MSYDARKPGGDQTTPEMSRCSLTGLLRGLAGHQDRDPTTTSGLGRRIEVVGLSGNRKRWVTELCSLPSANRTADQAGEATASESKILVGLPTGGPAGTVLLTCRLP
jgi:hypothetical protein